MLNSLYSQLVERFFGKEIQKRVKLAVMALDDKHDRLYSHSTYPRDRQAYDLAEVLREALEAWRQNPLARRIVELTSQYVVGGGLSIECRHSRTHEFLQEWWNHRLNHLGMRAFDWCDELTRSGNLFVVLSSDISGMTYLRAIPAADILEIETAENDVEQATMIWEKPHLDGTDQPGPRGMLAGRCWRVYNAQEDTRLPSPEAGRLDGGFEPVMLHYAINRPVGAKWGESDLAPLIRWLTRYAAWLEDRARLNRYRNTFLFWVKARFQSQAERLQRQAELNMDPPNPGSILVTDESEAWSVLAPNLASFEAAEDGLALKKMIAAGSGNPLHFLAEPESSTRTTAESAGGPTFRHYEKRQEYFLWIMKDIAQVVVRRRAMVDRRISSRAEIVVRGTDLSARDNAALATAAATVTQAFSQLRDRGLIDDAELLRMVYRFAGEVADVNGLLQQAKGLPLPTPWGEPSGRTPPTAHPVSAIKVDPVELHPITGEVKGLEQI